MRAVIMSLASLAALSACGGASEPASSADHAETGEATPATALPDPTMLPTPQQNSVAAMTVTCGGQPYKVAFTDFAATLTYDDGATQELPLQPPASDSEPGVSLYTDGKISFAKSGGGDTPTVIRFARGRMAWQDCAIAVN